MNIQFCNIDIPAIKDEKTGIMYKGNVPIIAGRKMFLSSRGKPIFFETTNESIPFINNKNSDFNMTDESLQDAIDLSKAIMRKKKEIQETESIHQLERVEAAFGHGIIGIPLNLISIQEVKNIILPKLRKQLKDMEKEYAAI